MAVLLDTHAFLWWCQDSPELSKKARKTITDQDCFLSVASCWEMAIKISLEKLTLPQSIERYLPEQMSLNGFEQMYISFRHVCRTAAMPLRHRDPFDRILVAQCQEENIPIVSRDSSFDLYGIKRIW